MGMSILHSVHREITSPITVGFFRTALHRSLKWGSGTALRPAKKAQCGCRESGIAADSAGNLYVITSNGTWDGTSNFSQSFVKLSPNLTVVDYFTPFNQAALSAADSDVGAGGVLLIPACVLAAIRILHWKQ
jgi:hypothetical protein